MHGETDLAGATADARRMRQAGRELLSLALIDSRNATLRWHAAFDDLDIAPSERAALRWRLGHAGWFQERWVVRNLQRSLGPRCDATLPPLASIEPHADAWFDPQHDATAPALPGPEALRDYLCATLETTLDLLARAAEDDAGLFFFRAALLREDAQLERLALWAQQHGVGAAALRALVAPRPHPASRPPIGLPATAWTLGSGGAGYAPDLERPAHAVAVPEFEIDAQPVSWAQIAEFVEDGGYDEPAWWSAEGARWKDAQVRSAPRAVEQLRGGVLARQFGTLVRVPLSQPAQHLSWYEAQAWCRWAGRRLPTEAEWEIAAHQAAGRGHAWGEVREWTAERFEPYPGYAADPWRRSPRPAAGLRTVRGASRWTAARLVHPKARCGAAPDRDDLFIGFRSVAL